MDEGIYEWMKRNKEIKKERKKERKNERKKEWKKERCLWKFSVLIGLKWLFC